DPFQHSGAVAEMQRGTGSTVPAATARGCVPNRYGVSGDPLHELVAISCGAPAISERASGAARQLPSPTTAKWMSQPDLGKRILIYRATLIKAMQVLLGCDVHHKTSADE